MALATPFQNTNMQCLVTQSSIVRPCDAIMKYVACISKCCQSNNILEIKPQVAGTAYTIKSNDHFEIHA